MPHTNYTPPCHLSNVTGTSTLCGCELSPAVLSHASMVQMQHTAVAQAGFDCHAEKVESNSFEELHLGNTGGATWRAESFCLTVIIGTWPGAPSTFHGEAQIVWMHPALQKLQVTLSRVSALVFHEQFSISRAAGQPDSVAVEQIDVPSVVYGGQLASRNRQWVWQSWSWKQLDVSHYISSSNYATA